MGGRQLTSNICLRERKPPRARRSGCCGGSWVIPPRDTPPQEKNSPRPAREFFHWTPDAPAERERHAGLLHVHEQRAAVGRETCPRELALARMRVPRQTVTPSAGGDPDHEVLSLSEIVLTHE